MLENKLIRSSMAAFIRCIFEGLLLDINDSCDGLFRFLSSNFDILDILVIFDLLSG